MAMESANLTKSQIQPEAGRRHAFLALKRRKIRP
jgi:hypothetical protein